MTTNKGGLVEPLPDLVSNGNGSSEEKKAKEYGRWVLFVIEHKAAFLLLGSMILGAYTTVQTLKSELVEVKADIKEMKGDIKELKDAFIEPTPTPKLKRR